MSVENCPMAYPFVYGYAITLGKGYSPHNDEIKLNGKSALLQLTTGWCWMEKFPLKCEHSCK